MPFTMFFIASFHAERIFLSCRHIATLKTSIIFVNDSWPNSEVEAAGDIDLPDALSSLTICFVGMKVNFVVAPEYLSTLSGELKWGKVPNGYDKCWKRRLSTQDCRSRTSLGMLTVFMYSRQIQHWIPLCKTIIKFLISLLQYRIIPSAVDFFVNRWQYPCVRSNLHRAELETNRQSIFGFARHRWFVRCIARDDFCRR